MSHLKAVASTNKAYSHSLGTPRTLAKRSVGIWRLLAVAAIAMFAGLAAIPACAVDLSQKVDFNIPAQDLGAALLQFSQQARVQIIVSGDIRRKTTTGITGQHEIRQALSQLLAPAGLEFQVASDTSITVAKPDAKTTAGTPDPDGEYLKVSRSDQAPDSGDSDQKNQLKPNSSPSTGEEGMPKIDEIVVTAQKREQSVKDVPISIGVLTGQTIERQGIKSLRDLSLAMPGISIQDRGAAGDRDIYVRGLGNVIGAPLVGAYLDEASIATIPGFSLDVRPYDLERVELLRGPQGTLYGENSMGGTLRYITKRPKLDRLELDGSVGASHSQDGGPSETAFGVVNLPLIHDKLAFRLAGIFENNGGWIDQPALGKHDINDEKTTDGRAKVLWTPVGALKVDATVIVHRTDAGALNVGEDNSGDYHQGFNLPTTPSSKNDYNFYDLDLDYKLASVDLHNSAAYVDANRTSRQQSYRLHVFGPAPAPSFIIFSDTNEFWMHSFVDELRIGSSWDSALRWTVGGVYRQTNSRAYVANRVGLSTAAPAPDPLLPTAIPHGDTESWSAFSEVGYTFASRLEVGAGARYFESRVKSYSEDVVSGLRTANDTARFNNLSPRLFMTYKATPGVNLYASIGKGFRSGGFSGNALDKYYEPDYLWNYELGMKMSGFDGRMDGEISAFYMDYKNVQVEGLSVLTPGTAPDDFLQNGGDVTIPGVDWNFTVRATGRLKVGFGGEYADSKYQRINLLASTHAVGDPLDYVSKVKMVAWTNYDFKWSDQMPGFVRVDYDYQGRSSFLYRLLGNYGSESGIITMLNARLGLQRNNWSVELFAENLLNDRDYRDPNWIGEFATRPRPRTLGLQFSAGL